MPSRRDQITMTDAEMQAFLASERTVICATNGPRGWPHLMPLWYVVRSGELWAWTFAKSQKTKNLERDPRATAQVEAGDSYEELRGVMIEAEVELVRDVDHVRELGIEIFKRYSAGPDGELAPEVVAAVDKQAAKRVGLRFRPERVVTWDHRKLGGTY